MAGLWYRTGSVAVTQSSKKVTGSGTSWLTALNRPSKGNVFYGPDGKAYEIDYISSETELYLVDAYAGAAATGQSYKIDVRGGTVPELSRQLSEHYAYMQGIIDSLQSIVSGSGDVTISGPSGQTVTVPALANMLSKSGNLSGLTVPDAALGNLGLTTVGKAVARAADAAAVRSVIGALPVTGGELTGGLSMTPNNSSPLVLDRKNQVGIQFNAASDVTRYVGVTTSGELTFGGSLNHSLNNKVYHVGFKPTAADVGAYSKTEMPYETGSFTPTVFGSTTPGAATYSQQFGRYTRIGNMVFFSIRLDWSGHTGSGGIRINGLPFSAKPISGLLWSIAVRFYGLEFSGQVISIISSTTTMSVQQAVSGNSAAVELSLPASGHLVLTGSYEI